ncbi:MAG: thymidine kinase [Pseudomonadota bacterium]
MMLHSEPNDTGWIEVVCGSMFSGKTEELIRRIRRAQIARQKVILFKPMMDDRYGSNHVVSHDQRKIEAVPVRTAKEILSLARDYEVVGIDEGQFLGMDLVGVCEDLANQGKRVIVSGLDQDYRGVPFEPIPQLLAIAEYITKSLAICMVCGNPANRSQRLVKSQERVVVGGTETYEARCRKCFDPNEKQEVKSTPAAASA